MGIDATGRGLKIARLLPMGGPPTSSNQAALMPSICAWSSRCRCVALRSVTQYVTVTRGKTWTDCRDGDTLGVIGLPAQASTTVLTERICISLLYVVTAMHPLRPQEEGDGRMSGLQDTHL